MALKHVQMHTILILLTIKQSNIIDFYGLSTVTKTFLNKFYILLHLLFYYYISACSLSEHARNILHIVTLVIDHHLVNHSKFINYFTTTVGTPSVHAAKVFYDYITTELTPFANSIKFLGIFSLLLISFLVDK